MADVSASSTSTVNDPAIPAGVGSWALHPDDQAEVDYLQWVETGRWRPD